jgi:hypothetical protein
MLRDTTCLRTLGLVLFIGLCVGASPIATGVAAAQDPSAETEDPAESRATEFRAVEGPEAESVPGGALLIGAYAIVWGALMIYLLRLGRMQYGLARDMERLERSLMADGGGSEQSETKAEKSEA